MAPAEVVRYALVVGSNLGGPGQEPLRFADDDARNVSDVLVELGGYEEQDVHLLLDPDPGELLEAIAKLGAQVAERRRDGEDVVATFYYSGHSRAQALDLGGQELALSRVREALQSLDASLTLVILDACQSGVASRPKGAEAAQDFSTNSVRGLDTEGFVVLASSSASELSQESDELQGSTFTHHLVSGLRGAADRERDGVVTLDEAYGYAYDRTVYTTAQTALGQQHPTLELDVSGQGGTVLTRPARSSALLYLPEGLAAEMVLLRADTGAVVAELHKAGEESLDLALVPAPYVAITKREDGRIERCKLVVEPDTTTIYGEAAQCTRVSASSPATKLGGRSPRWSLEVGLGGLSSPTDSFIHQLGAFGFAEGPQGETLLVDVSTALQVRRRLALMATVGNLEEHGLTRSTLSGVGPPEASYRWSSGRLTLSARGLLPLGPLALYAQAGVGPALVTHALDGERQWGLGFHFAAASGLQVPLIAPLGAYGELDYAFAPVLRNDLGLVHDLGGWGGQVGLRVSF